MMFDHLTWAVHMRTVKFIIITVQLPSGAVHRSTLWKTNDYYSGLGIGNQELGIKSNKRAPGYPCTFDTTRFFSLDYYAWRLTARHALHYIFIQFTKGCPHQVSFELLIREEAFSLD